MQKRRIYSLDLIRLYLVIVIAFYHAELHLEPGAETAVLFFFVIFGFFLGKKFYDDRDAQTGAWQYTIEHAKSIYPHLVFSVTMYYLYRLARYVLVDGFLNRDPGWLFRAAKDLYLLIPEYTMTLSAYHKYMSPNFALWQLSAMFICGYFIYALLRCNEKTARTILLPAGILMAESLNASCDMWANVGPVYMPLARAFAPMGVGYFLYYLTTTPIYDAMKKRRVLFDAASVLALIAIPVFKLLENISYFTIGIVILACWNPDSLINKLLDHRCFRRCGRLSMAVFLDHMMICRIVINPVTEFFAGRSIALQPVQTGIIYFAMMMVYSVCSSALVDRYVEARRAKKHQLVNH